jgi:hypothetical protein
MGFYAAINFHVYLGDLISDRSIDCNWEIDIQVT